MQTGSIALDGFEGRQDLAKLRVAIVHYWFVNRGGGERVVESLAEVFPQADLYAVIADRSKMAPILRDRKLQTSFLQGIPWSKRLNRHLLFLHPLALEQFDLSDYDLVISSESAPTKGVLTSSKTCHICYCHSPMRYIWDMYPKYRQGMGPLVRSAFTLTAHYMRMWDVASAGRVDYFAANSHFTASRIWKTYRRESTVIHPPVCIPDVVTRNGGGDYYLTVGRLVDYKRVDLAVEACTKINRPLRVVGDGPQYRNLKRIAGPTVQFLGALSDQDLHEQLSHCRALLFPGEEDFGIVPVEAQGFGRPVIAYASGGALETVRGIVPRGSWVDDPTGVFFLEQTASSLANAISLFEIQEQRFSPVTIRNHSLQFDSAHFKSKMAEFALLAMKEFSKTQCFGGSYPLVREEAPAGSGVTCVH
jgi:glycosyltransferase involved in cell wall biosynthesis